MIIFPGCPVCSNARWSAPTRQAAYDAMIRASMKLYFDSTIR